MDCQIQPDGSLLVPCAIPGMSYFRVEFGRQPRRRQRKLLRRPETVMDCLELAWADDRVRELEQAEWTPALLEEREFHAGRGERLWAFKSEYGNLITVPRPEPEDPYPVIEAMFAKQEALAVYGEALDPWLMSLLPSGRVAHPGQRLTRWGVRKSAADFKGAR